MNEPRSMEHILPIVWKRAKNDIVWDEMGNKYIDFTSGIFVQNFGHSNPRIKKAIKKQVDKNLIHSYMYQTEIRKDYTLALSRKVGKDKVFLLSSGTEATECAMKIMRKNGQNIASQKKKIVSFKGAMHGRTMAADLCKGTGFWSSEDFIVLPYKTWEPEFDLIQLYSLDTSKIAGIMIEAFEGWSCNIQSYQKEIRRWAYDNNIMICLDDIQAGIGRTNANFTTAYGINYHLMPDLICLGKGIGGGLPLSAVCGNKRHMDVFEYGEMSSTHSANPLVCAAGKQVIVEYNNFNSDIYHDFLSHIERLNDEHYDNIKQVNSLGAIAALIFDSEKTATRVVKRCFDKGLLVVHTGRESVKLGPPLTTKLKNLRRGFDILGSIIDEYC